ncbi:septum site-determining protein MinC [Burkholderia oklahomensis]|uniref:septum site-determining protein MinC n=1 Tax=Burkholderia oklahomensis TaxID=342113 RepID=UPI00016A7F86|nr:septum site-determining protein MinC [Burkholderia oklahomensis]AJX31112.1 septum site-determining protein MinC [Burkholderia oklahomensis C6786]AOI45199.1 septum formation inhibitor [Burkholderia oklahomensis C6786]KUY59502.1 septum formation inhibitor [Burkholderia oklahomensis C6786]MBI0358740.1 septum site-determining protein MinC [Burkholderia oklahomensis]MDN7672223.1 septum site-determining protein MinC [Burkholderia oklahomensis]
MSLKKSPFFELRSGSVDTLLFIVKTADLDALRAELVKRFEATPEFFADDVVAIDVRRLADGERVPLDDIRRMLNDVRMRAIGVVAQPGQHTWAAGSGLPLLEARDRRAPAPKAAGDAPEQPAEQDTPAAGQVALFAEAGPSGVDAGAQGSPVAPVVAPQSATLVIDKPLRSGQQIYAKGDLVVLGPVSYGAEVIAEGNIHIYAPLRGRALAGVHGNHDARIFCTCLEPELISIAGIYRTTENPLPADVLGKSVQIRLEQEKLMIEPLRLT